MRKLLLVGLALACLLVLALLVSPWPSVVLVRTMFDKGAADTSGKLAPHVPAAVGTQTISYSATNPDAVLDIHRPRERRPGAPMIVWIHGGGFVSGRRADVTNYVRLLAGQGFTVVNLDYTIAPEAHYPAPVRQVNQALAFLTREGPKLGIDPQRLVLAGDSAGAQIAAQTAAVITNPDYARLVGITPGASPDQLAGTLLYCGVYDISGMGKNGGLLGWFVQSAGWAYSGKRDWREDKLFQTMSIAPHITKNFPPAFISAGNADPLGPQSVAMSATLKASGVAVEELFFPPDYRPALGHEYQFDIDTEAGRMALARSVAWLNGL